MVGFEEAVYADICKGFVTVVLDTYAMSPGWTFFTPISQNYIQKTNGFVEQYYLVLRTKHPRGTPTKMALFHSSQALIAVWLFHVVSFGFV